MYHNSERMSDSFYQMTESSKLELKKKRMGPKHTHILEYLRRNTCLCTVLRSLTS